jgi:hypothetical protein
MTNLQNLDDGQIYESDESQYNFIEHRNPVETAMCIILAAAYLGLAKYCFTPLVVTKNWALVTNVEIFFCTIAALSIFIGIRPYFSPSSLQISQHGIKYQGPYWPRRKTINWEQIVSLYLSRELIIILYKPDLRRKRTWPLIIPAIYLSQRGKIVEVMAQYSHTPPIMMTSPALVSRIIFIVAFLAFVFWLLELMIAT